MIAISNQNTVSQNQVYEPSVNSELEIMCEAARDLKTNFALDGGLARAFLATWAKKNGDHSEVSNLIGPLSDIDLVCRANEAYAIVETIQAYMPWLKFFHVETRDISALEQPYSHAGNLVAVNPPRAWFIGNSKHLPTPTSENDVHFFVDQTPGPRKTPKLSPLTVFEWRDRPEGPPEDEAIRALFDVLFLLRNPLVVETVKEDRNVLLELVSRIQRVPSETLAAKVLGSSQDFRRLGILLLKALCFSAHNPSSKNPTLRDLGLIAYFAKFIEHLDDTPLTSLWIVMAKHRTLPFRALVSPVFLDGRWRRQLNSFEILDQRRSLTDVMQLEARETEILTNYFEGKNVSPVFSIETADAPDPNCCIYHDFSRGHLEAIWFDPSNPGGSQNLKQFLTPVGSRRFSDFTFTHSHQYRGLVNSARLDFGHLCAMTGRKQTLSFSMAAAAVAS